LIWSPPVAVAEVSVLVVAVVSVVVVEEDELLELLLDAEEPASLLPHAASDNAITPASKVAKTFLFILSLLKNS
jgi:hypothetical protein